MVGNIINEHQSAYIKGRYIEENARIILDILDNCEEHDLDGVQLSIDLEKCIWLNRI